MHPLLHAAISATLAKTIALEAHEQAISHVLAILECGGAIDVHFCGGGTSNPFIVADVANDPAVIGEIEAALASVGVAFSNEYTASGKTDRHYSGIPATLTNEDSIGVTLLLRLMGHRS